MLTTHTMATKDACDDCSPRGASCRPTPAVRHAGRRVPRDRVWEISELIRLLDAADKKSRIADCGPCVVVPLIQSPRIFTAVGQ